MILMAVLPFNMQKWGILDVELVVFLGPRLVKHATADPSGSRIMMQTG